MEKQPTMPSDRVLPKADRRRRGAARRLSVTCLLALALAAAQANAARREEALGDDAPLLAAAPVVSLQHLDFDARAGATVIGLTASGPLQHHTAYESGDDLVIEVPGADVSKLEASAEIGTPEVDTVRIEPPVTPGGLARIVVHRAAGTQRSIAVDPQNPRRLEITVTSGQAAARQAAPAPAAAAEPAPAGKRLASAQAPRAAATAPAASAPAAPPVVAAQPPAAPMARTASEALGTLRSAMSPAASPLGDLTPSKGPGRLLDARVETAQDGRVVLRLTSTGRLQGRAFILDTPPPRLVVDLPGTVNEVRMGSLPVRDADVLKVRIAQNQPLPDPVTRIVIELKSDGVPYELIEGPGSLLVAVGRRDPSAPAMASLDPALQLPAAAAAMPVAPSEPDLLSLPVGASRDVLPSEPLRETADASRAAQIADSTSRYQSVDVSQGGIQYQGEPISISMKDQELQEVFRLFHEFTGLNMILDQSIRGKTITLELVDVPWDQALQLVLQTNGLGSQLDGNVLRIAPLAKLAAEEQQKKQWQEAQELSGALQQTAIPLSYASGGAVEPIIRRSLSQRGDIQVDRRTNTIIITDLASRVEEVMRLVELLDTPTRQVQIEARILETTVDFSKATGVRWGFNYIADRAYGNQTGFSFPRSIASDYAVNLPTNGANSVLGLSFRNILNTFALDLELQALESRGKARVISRPMVMVQNNQRAEISSGFNIPITNTTATETDVTFVPATLSLRVTPQITADNNVIMDIEVNNDTPGFLVGENPSISTRNAKTVVAVPDGGTTVIGGIYTVNEGVSSGRVPFFSRIPLLGWLFRNKSVDRTNSELLIFLTPRIQKTG